MRAFLRRPGGCPASVQLELVPAWSGGGALGEWRFARFLQRRLAGTRGIVFSTLPLYLPEVTHYFSPGSLYRSGFETERDSFDPGLRQRLYRLGNRLNLQRRRWVAEQERLLSRPAPLGVLTLSAAARRQMLQLFPLAPQNVVTIPSGVAALLAFHVSNAASSAARRAACSSDGRPCDHLP